MNLPRHLRSVHNWSKQRSLNVLHDFFKRKDYVRREHFSPQKIAKGSNLTRKWINYHHPRICPVPTCGKVVKQLGEHLRKSHKMKQDAHYYGLLKKASLHTRWFIYYVTFMCLIRFLYVFVCFLLLFCVNSFINYRTSTQSRSPHRQTSPRNVEKSTPLKRYIKKWP